MFFYLTIIRIEQFLRSGAGSKEKHYYDLVPNRRISTYFSANSASASLHFSKISKFFNYQEANSLEQIKISLKSNTGVTQQIKLTGRFNAQHRLTYISYILGPNRRFSISSSLIVP